MDKAGALERQAAVVRYPGWVGSAHGHGVAAVGAAGAVGAAAGGGDGDDRREAVVVGDEPEVEGALAHEKRRAAGQVDTEAVRDGVPPRRAYDVEGSAVGEICLDRCADLTMYVLYHPNVGACFQSRLIPCLGDGRKGFYLNTNHAVGQIQTQFNSTAT